MVTENLETVPEVPETQPSEEGSQASLCWSSELGGGPVRHSAEEGLLLSLRWHGQ